MPGASACDESLAFWTQLAQGLCAGRPLGALLASIQGELRDTPLAEVVGALRDDVTSGKTLSEAMQRHPSIFGKHVLCLVEGGERAGILDRVALLILEHAWRCPTCILGAPAQPE